MRGVVAKLAGARRNSFRIPWCVPQLGPDSLTFVARAHLSGAIRANRDGEEAKLADDLRNYLGLPYVIPVNRGRTAIELALRSLALGEGDEVIVPSYLCSTALDGVRASGASAVFADVDDRLHVTPRSVEAALTVKTRCVLVAHLYGESAPISAIERITQARGLHLIDDAAQSLGATDEDRMVGTFGSVGIVSCGLGKSLAGPAGGALVTASREIHDRAAGIELTAEPTLRILSRFWGFLCWRWARKRLLPVEIALRALTPPWPDSNHISARISNLDAGIMRRQLRSISKHAKQRRDNLPRAVKALAHTGASILTTDRTHGMAAKLVAVLPENGLTRQEVLEACAKVGVEGQGWYQPLHLLADAASRPELPEVEDLWQRVICLPLVGPWDAVPEVRFNGSKRSLPLQSAAGQETP